MRRALKYIPNSLATAVRMENSFMDRLQGFRKSEDALGEVGAFAISGVHVSSAIDITRGGSAGITVTSSIAQYLKCYFSNIEKKYC